MEGQDAAPESSSFYPHPKENPINPLERIDFSKLQAELERNARIFSQSFPTMFNYQGKTQLGPVPALQSGQMDRESIANCIEPKEQMVPVPFNSFFDSLQCFEEKNKENFHCSSTNSESISPKRPFEAVELREKRNDEKLELEINSNGPRMKNSQPIDSRQLRVIKEHNEKLNGIEKKQWNSKFLKYTEKVSEFFEKLPIQDDSGIKSETFRLLHPLVPALGELFHSKGFNVVFVGIIAFVCKFKQIPLTTREIVMKVGLKEKPVNKVVQKLKEIYPNEASSEVNPKAFILRIVESLKMKSEKDSEELLRLSLMFLGNITKVRVSIHEHALTVATLCVYLACLVKKNEFADIKRMAEATGVSKVTLLNIYNKYFPFRDSLLEGIEPKMVSTALS